MIKDCLKIKIDDNVVFEATPRQTEYLLSEAQYPLFGGAMRGGKTYALCGGALFQSLKYPGNRGYIGRKTFADFRKTTLVTLLKVIPSKLLKSHNKSDKVIELVNGSLIEYGDFEDWNKLRSLEIGWAAIDEASEIDETTFNVLATRIGWWKLPDGSIPEQKIYLASNPDAGFLYNRWVKAYEGLLPKEKNFTFYPALPRDNPYITQEFIDNLYKVLPSALAKRYLDGSWHIVLEDNPVYGNDFNPELHGKRGLIFNPMLPIYRGWDFGLNPSCVFAQLNQGRLFIPQEYTISNGTMGLERFVDQIILPAVQNRFRDYQFYDYCDPSGFFQSQIDMRSCIDVLNERGIYPIAGELGQEKRRQSVSKYLNSMVDGEPCLFLDIENCPVLFQGFLGRFKYAKRSTISDDLKFEKTEESHSHEALQYLCSGIDKSGVGQMVDLEEIIKNRPAILNSYIFPNTI